MIKVSQAMQKVSQAMQCACSRRKSDESYLGLTIIIPTVGISQSNGAASDAAAASGGKGGTAAGSERIDAAFCQPRPFSRNGSSAAYESEENQIGYKQHHGENGRLTYSWLITRQILYQ